MATYNRARLLPRLIDALERQRPRPAQVVVVDDGSTDDTSEVLSAVTQRTTLPLTVIRQAANTGPAAARNRGWRSTQARLVAFTDDDCVPRPGWLAALAEAACLGDIVQGRTMPDPDQSDRLGPFSRTLDVAAMNWFFQTCNIAYRHEWLERAGGFDEQFRHPMGEDTDLAWRAIDAGARAVFADAAVVLHDVRPSSFTAQLRDSARWESVALVVRKHPGLRARLHRPYFWKAAHPPVALAAAGLLLVAAPGDARCRALGAALTAPYLKHRLVDAPLPRVRRRRRVLLLPFVFALDAAEVAVLARASLRYRTLVL